MNRKSLFSIGIVIWLAALGGLASSAQDKYTVKVPGGLAFSSSGDTKTGGLSRSVRPES